MLRITDFNGIEGIWTAYESSLLAILSIYITAHQTMSPQTGLKIKNEEEEDENGKGQLALELI